MPYAEAALDERPSEDERAPELPFAEGSAEIGCAESGPLTMT